MIVIFRLLTAAILQIHVMVNERCPLPALRRLKLGFITQDQVIHLVESRRASIEFVFGNETYNRPYKSQSQSAYQQQNSFALILGQVLMPLALTVSAGV